MTYPDLYKHCPTRHYPAPGRKIKIGSMLGYQRDENGYIQDGFEGVFKYDCQFNFCQDYDLDQLKEFTFGLYPFMGCGGHFLGALGVGVPIIPDVVGVLHFADQGLDIVKSGTGSIRLSGSLVGHFERTDMFIFCLSESPEPNLIKDPDYDATYRIPSKNIPEFLRRATEEMHKEILREPRIVKNGSIGPFEGILQLPEWCSKASLSTRYSVFKVDYLDKIIKPNPSDMMHAADKIRGLLQNCFRIKPKEYVDEREWRFAFEPRFSYLNEASQLLYYPLIRRFCSAYVPAEPFLDLIEHVRGPGVSEHP